MLQLDSVSLSGSEGVGSSQALAWEGKGGGGGGDVRRKEQRIDYEQ